MLNPIPSHPLFAAPDSIHELLDEIRSLPDGQERQTAMLFACLMMNACSKAVGQELERTGLTETL